MSNHLADEARARGIEPIELKPGDDLEQLVRDAVAGGADGLAAAGGDGTQALVASIAAEHDLPFACIPAGTRNHFALDLGVDRDDVVGALDAFVNGGERRVDLAEVNGRVFVNNVVARALRRGGAARGIPRRQATHHPRHRARRARLSAERTDERAGLARPGRHRHESAAVILVSNNTYRLGRAVGSGTRPRIDGGELGVAVLKAAHRAVATARRRWQQWSTPDLRGHLVATGARRRRRRGARPGSAASLRQPAERAAGAPRAAAPRRLTVGRVPEGISDAARTTACRGRRTGLRLPGHRAVAGRARTCPMTPRGARRWRSVAARLRHRRTPCPARRSSSPGPAGPSAGRALLLALVVLVALLIPAGPLALDSRWSELMQDIETPFLTHVALVFNALGHGVWRALTIAGIGIVLLRRAPLGGADRVRPHRGAHAAARQPDQGGRRPGAPPGPDARGARLVLPFRPRRLRRRDRCRARAPLQQARPAAALVVHPGRRWRSPDGLEPHLPAGALALRRGRGRNPRPRGRSSASAVVQIALARSARRG